MIHRIGIAVGQKDLVSGEPTLEQFLGIMYIKKISAAVIDCPKELGIFGDGMVQAWSFTSQPPAKKNVARRLLIGAWRALGLN